MGFNTFGLMLIQIKISYFFSRLNTFMGLVNFQMYLYTFMKKYKPVPYHVVLYCFSLEQLSTRKGPWIQMTGA